MKILITGGRGFIGSHLGTKLVELKHDVLSLDDLSHPSSMEVPFENIEGSVTNEKWVDDFVKDTDIVIHLAAQINVDHSLEDPNESISTNIFGTLVVLNAVQKHGKRLIYASSSEVYGSGYTQHMEETHPLDAMSPYGVSKLAADRMCYAYYKSYGTDLVILRNFNTFGPYQRDDSYGGVIAKFCKAGSQGKPLEIYGDGTQTRDYMWIDDAVNAYITLIEKNQRGEVYNAGTSTEVSVNRIADIISGYYGVPIRHVDPRPGEVQRLCAQTKKLQALGWKSHTNFEQDLLNYIKWYENNARNSSRDLQTSKDDSPL